MKRTIIGSLIMAAILSLVACTPARERAAEQVAQAQAYLDGGDLLAANKAILKALKLRDDNSDYWMLAGRIALARKDLNGAFAAYNHAWELDSTNPETVQVLAEFSFATDRLEDADRFSDQLLVLVPDQMRARAIKGGVALRHNDLAAAAKIIDPLIEQYPTNADVMMLKARLFNQSNKKPEAIVLIEQLLPLTNNRAEALKYLISVYRDLRDVVGFEKSYARLFAVSGKDPDVQLAYARVLLDRHKLPEALSMIDRLLVAHADSATYFAVENILFESNSGDLSFADLQAAVPRLRPQAQIALAEYALDRGRLDLARQWLNPALAANIPQAGIVDVMILAAQGKQGEAQTRLASILSADPTNPDALLLRSRIALDRGDLDAAEADAQLVVRDNPNLARARLLLAQVYVAKHEPVLADNIFRSAINDLPDNARIVADYAAYLTGAGRTPEALAVAQDFTQRKPDMIRAWRIQLGLCDKGGDKSCAAAADQNIARIISKGAISG